MAIAHSSFVYFSSFYCFFSVVTRDCALHVIERVSNTRVINIFSNDLNESIKCRFKYSISSHVKYHDHNIIHHPKWQNDRLKIGFEVDSLWMCTVHNMQCTSCRCQCEKYWQTCEKTEALFKSSFCRNRYIVRKRSAVSPVRKDIAVYGSRFSIDNVQHCTAYTLLDCNPNELWNCNKLSKRDWYYQFRYTCSLVCNCALNIETVE